LVSLRDITDQPVDLVERVELSAERLDPDQIAGTVAVEIRGRLAPYGDGFLFTGELRADGEVLCSRCLAPVPWTTADELVVELRHPEPEHDDPDEVELGEGDLEVIFLDGDELDLADLAAEQVVLGLPMRTLCRADCAGLCPTCGANLNHDPDCGCQPETDPRWEALRALKEKPS
jgi:uncharacterized protein